MHESGKERGVPRRSLVDESTNIGYSSSVAFVMRVISDTQNLEGIRVSVLPEIDAKSPIRRKPTRLRVPRGSKKVAASAAPSPLIAIPIPSCRSGDPSLFML